MIYEKSNAGRKGSYPSNYYNRSNWHSSHLGFMFQRRIYVLHNDTELHIKWQELLFVVPYCPNLLKTRWTVTSHSGDLDSRNLIWRRFDLFPSSVEANLNYTNCRIWCMCHAYLLQFAPLFAVISNYICIVWIDFLLDCLFMLPSCQVYIKSYDCPVFLLKHLLFFHTCFSRICLFLIILVYKYMPIFVES
jgi:hypothetical protein